MIGKDTIAASMRRRELSRLRKQQEAYRGMVHRRSGGFLMGLLVVLIMVTFAAVNGWLVLTFPEFGAVCFVIILICMVLRSLLP